MPTVPYDEMISELYAKEPVSALVTLQSTLDDGEPAELVVLQRQLGKAFGGDGEVSEAHAGEAIRAYRSAQERGDLPLAALGHAMKQLGLRIVVVPELVRRGAAEREDSGLGGAPW